MTGIEGTAIAAGARVASAPEPDRCRQHPDVDDCWDQHGYYGMEHQ